MFKTLNNLIQEKVVIESKIRSVRILAIRKEVANLISKRVRLENKVLDGLDSIENMVAKVHFSHQEMDNLLDLVEYEIDQIL